MFFRSIALRANRPSAFVIAPSDHGTMIVNRNDYRQTDGGLIGVGAQILNNQHFDRKEVNLVLGLLNKRHQIYQKDVVAIDCGANIGVHTIEWARLMHGWGQVHAFEAQERIYYALAGNIAIKTAEGTARQIGEYLGAAMRRTLLARIGYMFASSAFGYLRQKLDPRRANGAVFLGLNGIVIKSHGGTDAEGFAAAIEMGHDMAVYGINEKILSDLRHFGSQRSPQEQ